MSTQSFTLTKEMRAKLADQLTGLAVSKHAKKLGTTLKKMNADFWAEHLANVDVVLQIDRSRHNELIIAGVVAATSTTVPICDGSELVKIHKNSDRSSYEVMLIVLRSDAFQQAGVADFIKNSSGYSEHYSLSFKSQSGSVPRLNNMGQLDAGHPITKKATKVREDLVAIVSAALDFRKKTVDILNSCRTSRQLLDIFPEAAKLLPQPVKSSNALAPVELVSSVREMLNAGVPNLSE